MEKLDGGLVGWGGAQILMQIQSHSHSQAALLVYLRLHYYRPPTSAAFRDAPRGVSLLNKCRHIGLIRKSTQGVCQRAGFFN